MKRSTSNNSGHTEDKSPTNANSYSWQQPTPVAEPKTTLYTPTIVNQNTKNAGVRKSTEGHITDSVVSDKIMDEYEEDFDMIEESGRDKPAAKHQTSTHTAGFGGKNAPVSHEDSSGGGFEEQFEEEYF